MTRRAGGSGQTSSGRTESAPKAGQPSNWRAVVLADVVESMKNGIYKPVSAYADDGIACLRMYNIDAGQIVWRDIKRIRLSGDERREFELRPGDLLVNRVNSRELVGKAAVIPSGLEPCVFESKNIRVRLRTDLVVPAFVSYRLQAEGTRYFTRNAQQVVGMASISQPQVGRFPLPLPSLDEQQAIVAEIEKQFTSLDAGGSALKRVQANLRRYRAAVLKAACEGRLVPTEAELARREGRAYETGGELLARILEERRRKWMGRGKYKTPVPPQMDWLGPIPEGWGIASADQISSHITSGSRDWSQFYGKGSGVFILAQNVRPMALDLSAPQTVDAPEGDPETERTRVQIDDLLVTIVGARTRDVCRVRRELHDHFVCQSVALLRPVLPRTSLFVELYLASPENGQAQWKRFVYGQGRPHLSFEQLRMTAIPLPPLAEQAHIVAEVERRFSVVDEIEATVAANLQRATRLRQAVLQSAFWGRLADSQVSA